MKIDKWLEINRWPEIDKRPEISKIRKVRKPREASDKIMPDFAGFYLMKRFTCIYHLFYKWLVVEEWGFRLKYSYLY